MPSDWKDLFAFTSGERNGIAVLLILLCIPMVLIWWPYPIGPPIQVAYSSLDSLSSPAKTNMLDSETEVKPISESNQFDSKAQAPKSKVVANPVALYSFNPNDSLTSFWSDLGWSPKQVQSIKNYLAAGGRFRVKTDVSKLFVVSDSAYRIIAPYVELPDSLPASKPAPVVKKSSKYSGPAYDSLRIHINRCDTTDLVKLKGIGAWSAKQIIFYRNKLGGFVSVTQLYEVPGLRETTIEHIGAKIVIDSTQVVQLAINSASASQMVKHPYITWHMAKEIEGQRKFGKKYVHVSDLLKYGLLDEELYIKIVPYLKL